MEQIAMDYAARARHSDPATSQEAAAGINGKQLAERVIAELAHGAGTAHELADRLGLSLVTVSPRMKPLETAGRVVRSGRKDGRTVWRLA